MKKITFWTVVCHRAPGMFLITVRPALNPRQAPGFHVRLLCALLMVCCLLDFIPDPGKKGVRASLDVVAGPAKCKEFPTDTLHCRSLVHQKTGLQVQYTWRLPCSSFFGSILESLTRKQVRTKQELHRSLLVDPKPKPELCDQEAIISGCLREFRFGTSNGLVYDRGVMAPYPESISIYV